MGFLSFLATPLGYVMEFITQFVPNYGMALIIFTVILKVVMFPLNIKQQKSTARMSAYQPFIQDIQKKYAKDKQKQQEEMMKFQQEHGMSMTAGCLPMALNMFVLFGLIQVLYYPLQYIFHIGADVVNTAAAAVGVSDLSINIMQSKLMEMTNANPAGFVEFFGDKAEAIGALKLSFLGMDLNAIPSIGDWTTWILPVLTIVTMIGSQIITMKMSGQEMQGAMKWMPWIMSIMFIGFCFTVPIGFSLYYTVSNILMFIQSVILKKMYDPDKIKAEIAAEIEAKRAEKKRKKTVKVIDEKSGVEEVKVVNEAELARIRQQKARELDEEKYSD